jgi:hypothetical protein
LFGIGPVFVRRFARVQGSAGQQILDYLGEPTAFARSAELQFAYQMLR